MKLMPNEEYDRQKGWMSMCNQILGIHGKYGKCACCDNDATAYCHSRNAWTCAHCFIPQADYPYHEKITELIAEIDDRDSEINRLKAEIESLRDQIEIMKRYPCDPCHIVW